MEEMVSRSGFKTSELFVLVLAHALVLLSPLAGYKIDGGNITFLLALDAGYMGLRGGQKIATVVSKPKEMKP